MAARAEEPAQQAPAAEEYTPEEGLPHPAAPDLRRSHLLLSAGGVVAVPSVNLVPVPAGASAFRYGGGPRGSVGLGLNRHVLLRLDGGASWFRSGAGCADCRAMSADVGASLAYVLVQGIAFEPWAAYGAGYRYASSEVDGLSETAHGLDVARISLGGDFFPVPSFGFGPFIETDIGVRVSPDTAGYVAFAAGLRFTFDPLRMGTQIAPTIAAR